MQAATAPETRSRARQPGTVRVMETLLVLAVALIALAVRLYQLGARSLWVDEAMSVVFSSKPLPELFTLLVTDDVHPPLYPVLLHFWMLIAGSSEAAARLPSVLFGTAVIPLMYLMGKRLEGMARAKEADAISLVGMVGAILAATSSFYVGFSQEARSYMALTFLGLLSSYLLLGAVSAPSRRRWIYYTLATIAALYTHYAAFLLIFFHLAYLLLAGRPHRGAIRGWLASCLAMAVAYMPWLGYSVGQIQRISDYWPGTLQMEAALRTSLLQFVAGGGVGLKAMVLPAALGIALLALGLLALAGGGARRHRSEHVLFLLLYLLLPSALLFALAYYRPKFDPRYLLVVTPAFYLILAWGIASLLSAAKNGALHFLARALLPTAGIAALAGLILVSAMYGEPSRVAHVGDGNATIPEYGDYRSLVAYLEQNAQPGDAVVLMMNTYHPYEYYNRLGLPHFEMEPFDDFDGAIIRLNRMREAGYTRLWFILWQKEWADPAGFVMHTMETQSTEVPLSPSFGGLGLRLFQLPATERFSYYPKVANKADAIFGKSLEFWGWNQSAGEAPRGGTVEFDIHWRPISSVGADYKVVLSLLDGDGHLWARTDEVAASPTYPSTRWKPRDIIHDRHSLSLPAAMPPGSYNVQLQLYDSRTLQEVPIAHSSGTALGTTLPLGQITVTAAPAVGAQAASPAAGQWELGPDRLELLGHGVGQATARPGETVEVSVTWRAGSQLTQDYRAHLALLDPRGDVVARQTVALNSSYPTPRWQPGEVVESRYRFSVPLTAEPDGYRLAVAPVAPGQEEPPRLSLFQMDRLEVQPLPGVFQLPAMRNQVGARLGDRVTLAGYDLPSTAARPGEAIRLTLYWQADGPLDRSYKVFTHIIDEETRFAGQKDSVPIGGNRPTTTWRKGEVLVDQYEIPISKDARPGSYQLKVGMYAQDSGARLAVTSPGGTPGDDSIVLGIIEVRP